MIRHYSRTLHKTIVLLDYEAKQTYPQERERGAYSPLNETERRSCTKLIACVLNQYRELKIEGLDSLVRVLESNQETIGLAEYRTTLVTFRNLIENASDNRTFAYIPKDRASFFEQEKPFGNRVAKRFPKANREAGNAS